MREGPNPSGSGLHSLHFKTGEVVQPTAGSVRLRGRSVEPQAKLYPVLGSALQVLGRPEWAVHDERAAENPRTGSLLRTRSIHCARWMERWMLALTWLEAEAQPRNRREFPVRTSPVAVALAPTLVSFCVARPGPSCPAYRGYERLRCYPALL
jgi:hypothetical protein